MRRLRFAFAVPVALASTAHVAAADVADRCAETAESAQRLRDANHLQEAVKQLEQCSAQACPAIVRRDCQRWLDEVQVLAPTIAIRAFDSRSQGVEGAIVTVDGQPFATQIDGAARGIDPGPHHVKATATSGAVAEADVVIATGEKARVIELRFLSPLRADGTADAVAPAPPQAPLQSRWAENVTTPADSAPVLGYVLLGASIIGLAVGGIAEGTGVSDWQTLKDGCARNGSCPSSDVDSARTRLWYVAPAGFAVGVLSGAAAVWLLLTHHGEARAASAIATW
jgi:hypothetical protein